MGNLTSALQQLRAERKQAQLQVEKLDQAISVIESLNGSRIVRHATQPTRVISAEGTAAHGASEDNGAGSREAHHVNGSPEEDRGVSTCKVGEGEGSAEEGGIASPPTFHISAIVDS